MGKYEEAMESLGWIDVEEYKPTEGTPVFATNGKDIMVAAFCYFHNEGWFWCNADSSFYYDYKNNVWECDAVLYDAYEIKYWKELPLLAK